jgi:predicted metal-dependent hydrolase
MHKAPDELGQIKPRAVHFKLDPAEVPRWWFGGYAVPTQIVNALHLIFPMGERFFVRAVRHYQDQITDPTLREQIKGFFGQEGRHAHQHELAFDLLEAQGYEIQPFLRLYKKVAYDWIERVSPPGLRLAATAALEHYTAILAEGALEHGTIDAMHPSMRDLLRWHAAEEIEHKAVAFDVLKQVNPSYALRMAGMAVATTTLISFWVLGVVMLLRQEKGLSRLEILRQLRAIRQREPILSRVFLRGLREYLKRDFHPWQRDNLAIAREILAEVEAA